MTPREQITLITHGDLTVHNPLPPAALDDALGRVTLGPGDRVADVGCGTGELLLGVAERTGASAAGVDLSAPAIDRANAAARDRGLAGRVSFVQGDAGAFDPGDGTFALAVCIGSTHALGGLEATARRLHELLAPGGHALIADGYWRRDPDPAYLTALGATRDELPDWAGMVRRASVPGLRAVYASVASQADWDRYEWTLIANGERWAADHPEDPAAPDVLAWVDDARERLLAPGGRETIGFGQVLLRQVYGPDIRTKGES
jgi:SAM-dependent methyltransferase